MFFNLAQISADYNIDNNDDTNTNNQETSQSNRPKNKTLKRSNRRLVKSDLPKELTTPVTSDIYNSLDENEIVQQKLSPDIIWNHGVVGQHGLLTERMTAGKPGLHIYIETSSDSNFIKVLAVVTNNN